eukprot:TRINITY_DN879_c1_g1_i10.p1 TRINITY_DN879_c1_g1~~TRINITY_DN879_c1_g1_i10.p1  ORF type:complete len:406 (-),score=166.65 TRINITY_DN879_c1_g1_i10:400-1617(-)
MYRSLAYLCLFVAGLASVRAEEEAPSAKSLTEDNFKDEVSAGPHFVMFFAPWCGHCKRLAPTWDTLAEKYNKDADQEVKIGKVDCTQQTALCSAQDVTGYPTLKFFKSGAEKEDGVKYRGNRDQAALEKFIRESMGLEPEAAADSGEAAEKPASAEAEVKDGLSILTAASFEKAVSTGDSFVKFYAPWCGHCIKLAPTWDSLAKEFEADDRVKIAKIDCTAHQSVCQENEVRGYPTLAYFRAGKKVEAYKGGRGLDDLKGFVSAQLGTGAGDAAATKEKEPEKPSAVAKLDKDSFKAGVEKGVTFVKFFAPWCGHCKRLAPTWEQLAQHFADNEGVSIADVDCTVAENANRALCDGEGVNGFPTLNIYNNGEKADEYTGKRDFDSLLAFVEKHVKGGEAKEKDEL